MAVFLVLTKAAYQTFQQHSGAPSDVLWVNDGVLTEAELQALRSQGRNVTNFTTPIEVEDEKAINDALATVEEHHPEKDIRVLR